MARTRRDLVSDGSTTVFNIDFSLGYIKREYIYVYLKSESYENQLSYSWLNDNQIELAAPLAEGTEFHIRRVVPRDMAVNDYEQGAILHEQNLDDSYAQPLMVLEEIQDGYFLLDPEEKLEVNSDIIMNFHKILDLGRGINDDSAARLGDTSPSSDPTFLKPYEVPPFAGNVIELPNAVFYAGVVIDGRTLPPSEYSHSPDTKQVTLSQPVDVTNRVVVTRVSRAPEAGEGVLYDVEIEPYIQEAGSVAQGIATAADVARGNGRALVARDASKTYVLDAPIDLEGLDYIDFRCKFDTTALDKTEDWCIRFGGLAESDSGGYINIGDVLSSNPSGADMHTAKPQVRIEGMKGFVVHFDNIRYLQLYVNDGVEYDSISYNSMYFKSRVGMIEATGVPTIQGDPRWINENTFHNGRSYKVIFRDNGYPHNHNKFYDMLMEGAESEIRIENGDSNWFYGVRWEGVASSKGIFFGDNTINNHVLMTWISSLQAREKFQSPLKGAPYTDTGKGNVVAYQNAANAKYHTVFSFNASKPMISYGGLFNQPSASPVKGILGDATVTTGNVRAGVIPGLTAGDVVQIPVEFKQLGESPLIPVHRGSVFGYVATLAQGSWRLIVKCYDKDGLPLDDPNALSIPAGTYQTEDTGTYISSNLGTTDPNNTAAQYPLTFSVLAPECKYIWTAAVTGDTVDNHIIDITCRTYEEPNQDYYAAGALGSVPQGMWLNEPPTMGIVSTGSTVETSQGTYSCVLSLRTTAVNALSSGKVLMIKRDQQSLVTERVSEGDIIGVTLDDKTVHWSTIKTYNASTKTVTMLDALPIGRSVAAGAVVGITRWEQPANEPLTASTTDIFAEVNKSYLLLEPNTINLPTEGLQVGDYVEFMIISGEGGLFLLRSTMHNTQYFDSTQTSQILLAGIALELSNNLNTSPLGLDSTGRRYMAVWVGDRWQLKY